MQATPLVPHALLLVPASHPLDPQQPLGHVVALQTHEPF